MSAPDSEILIGDPSTSPDGASGEANADLLAELERLKACVAALEAKAKQSPDATSEQSGRETQHREVTSQLDPKQVPVAKQSPAATNEPEDKVQPAPANEAAMPHSRPEPGKNGKSAREQQPDTNEAVVAVKPPRPISQPDTGPAATTSQPQSVTGKVPARPSRPVSTNDHKTNGKAAAKGDRKTKPARPESERQTKPVSPESERKKVTRPVPLAAVAASPDRDPSLPAEFKQTPPDAATEKDDESHDEAARPKRHWIAALLFRDNIPGWSASMIVHAIAIVALALWTLATPEEEQEIPIVANSVEVIEDMEEIEEELDLVVEKPIVEEFVPDVSDVIEDPGEAMLGDLSNTETAAPSDLGDLAMIDIGALGLDIDLMGDGKGKKGDGIGVASFFGVTTRGRKFMYVVDNSNSMNAGKFEMACNELFKSISGLSYDHEFYIIFYSDAAYPLFYPRTAPRWVKATPENVEKVRYWLDDVHRCLQTRGEEAMTKAFQMRPDVIYLLGDGSFTDKAVPTTLGFNDPNVVVHTMGFGMKAAARKGFEDISTKFKGKFHEVEVIPAAVKASKEKNRPKNNQQNGVWGINLGNGKKKKK